jgi:predicted DNA-binding protein with PD1-like motif
VFGRPDYSVIGVHVKEAWVHPTFEIWLRTEDISVNGACDQATGLDLLDLAGVR